MNDLIKAKFTPLYQTGFQKNQLTKINLLLILSDFRLTFG